MHAQTRSVLAVAAITTVFAVGLAAQKTTPIHPGRGGSPHVRTEWSIDGAQISIEYGRPYVKGRKIFGGLEAYGRVWRTGADEATVLTTDTDLTFGDLRVPAGKYTLWTLLDQKAWQLIVNRETGQWGLAYNGAQDLGRAPMKTEQVTRLVEQFTISIEDTPEGGLLIFEWEHTRASIPFKVG